MPVTMCLLNHDAQFTSGKIRLSSGNGLMLVGNRRSVQTR